MTRRLRGAVLLVCALAAAPAHAVPSCTVATGAVLSFGPVVALASSPDADANTGGSLWVNCSADVENAPRLYSGSERTLVGVGGDLPFRLSLSAPGGPELPSAPPGDAVAIVRDGSNRAVVLHGRLRAAEFRTLPAGRYQRVIELTIEY